jgi:hypothetical protein
MTEEKPPSIPFDPASADAPFAGRDQNIQKLCDGLKAGRSFQLFGPPKIGKTCVLRRVAEQLATVRPLLPVHVICERVTATHRDVVTTVLRSTADALQCRVTKQLPIDLYRRVMDREGSDSLRAGLAELQSWGLQLQGPHRVALLLDGLHRLKPSLTAELANTLYGIVNNNESQLVWCGRERLRHEVRDDVSPLPLLFTQHIPLEPLTEEETRQLIGEAEHRGASVEPGFASTLHQMTNGHPYRLQYYLHAAMSSSAGAMVRALYKVHTRSTIEYLNEILTARGSAAAAQPVTNEKTVFISYSHDNEEEMQQLVTHLRVLESSGLAVTWVDDLLQPGSDWQQEITERIDAADLAVLMISAPFLKPGGFILRTELPRILERHRQGRLHILPVVVRACDWQSVSEISCLTVKPKNARPLWRAGISQPDEELTRVVQQVRSLLQATAS